MMEPKAVYFTERELHMMGEYVAVCWNLRHEKITRNIEGVRFEGTKVMRSGNAYIDFVTVVSDRKDDLYEDDDTIADGGMEPETARQVAAELIAAADYIKGLEG